MNSLVKNTWSETHPIVKTGITIVVAGIGIYFVYKIIKSTTSLIDQWSSRKEGNQALESLVQLALQGINPTLSDSEVESMVNGLRTELDDTYVDDDVVMNILYKVQNKADWEKLKYRWGSQDVGNGQQTITEALSDRLYSSSKSTLNQIFISKGIGTIV
jgi:hypothetical protein